MGKGGGMADIADGDITHDLPSYDPRNMSSIDRSDTNAHENANRTANHGSDQQQMSSGNGAGNNGEVAPPERYASRDVELYASSFAPPPEELDKSAGAAANAHDSGDDNADDEGEDASTHDVRVRRDVRRRFLTFFGAVLLLSITIGFFVPLAKSRRAGNNNSMGDALGLRGNEHPIVAPPSSSLGDLCATASRTTDPILTRECFQECDKAMCCTYPPDDARNCVDETTEVICAAYDEACSQYGGQGYGIGDGDGGEEYLDGEMDGESNVGDGTGDSNADTYTAYGDTSNLENVELAQAPENLDEICSPFALSSGGLSARADCTSICSEFQECCRDDACLASNTAACGTYNACENLLQPEMALDPSDIPTYCHGRGVVTKERIMACKALCEPGLCCLISPFVGKEKDGLLRGMESCVNEKGADFCGMYSECDILLDVGTENLGLQDNEDATENEEDSLVIPLAPQNIEDICSKRSLMNIDMYRECKDACTEAKCCWSKFHYTCEKKTSTHRCDEYAPCVRLEGREPGVEVFDDDDWDDEADGKYVVDIMEDLDEPSDAYRDENTGFSTGSTVTKAKIDAACSASSILTPSGEKVCEGLCKAGACCLRGTCGGNAVKMNCSMYKACDIIRDIQREKELTGHSSPTSEIDDSTAKGILQKALQVQDTCTESNVATPNGRKACERLCLSHLCCFAPENDCAESLGTQCLEYAACKHLIDWDER